MKLEEAPQWVQEIVVNTALGLLERKDAEVIRITNMEAVIRAGNYTYTVDKYYGRVY